MALDIVNTATTLAPAFAGQLLGPGDATYDDARRVHNGLIDKRPALIARCRGAADVVDAVGIAQRLHLETAVRGGGHNVAGRDCRRRRDDRPRPDEGHPCRPGWPNGACPG